jgi:predicted PurR-regulated permease PerM
MEQFAQNYRKYAFAVVCILALVMAAIMMVPFYPAIMWAAVLSVLLWPIHKRLKPRFGDTGAAGLTTLSGLLIIGIPLTLVGMMLTLQISSYAGELSSTRPNPSEGWTPQTVLETLDLNLKPLVERLGAPNFSMTEWYEKNQEQLQKNIGQGLITALKQGGIAVLTLVFAFLTMFFMLRDGHRLRDPALELLPVPREKGLDILEKMQRTIQAVFIGVVLVAVIQGLLAGLAYWIAGVPSPLIWCVATMILCAIPLLGAPVVYIPMALILFASGKPFHALGLLLFGFLVISQIDNLLRPFIIGARVELHPMAIFFSLLGGILMLGPVGLMAGPVLLTVLLALQEILRESLRKPEPDAASA